MRPDGPILELRQQGGAIDYGIYKGDPDKPLYVCAANVGGKGKQPGYNLASAAGANKCVVGYDFREVAVGTFDCLCKNWIGAGAATRWRIRTKWTPVRV